MDKPGAAGRPSNSSPGVREVEERIDFEAGDGMSYGFSGRNNSSQRKGKHRCSKDLLGLCAPRKSRRMEPLTREEAVGDEIRELENLSTVQASGRLWFFCFLFFQCE